MCPCHDGGRGGGRAGNLIKDSVTCRLPRPKDEPLHFKVSDAGALLSFERLKLETEKEQVVGSAPLPTLGLCPVLAPEFGGSAGGQGSVELSE